MGTLVCTVTLDKNAGVTVEIDNSSANITQKITMDGTQITLSVADNSNTSTIVQKADSIVITCNDFTLDTQTITCKSKKASSWNSQDAFSVQSTKDLTLQSQAGIKLSATQDAQISGQNVKADAQQSFECSGATGAKMASSGGETNISGLTLKMAGQTQAELSSVETKISGSAQLDCESTGMSTFKGSMTQVAGQLIQVG